MTVSRRSLLVAPAAAALAQQPASLTAGQVIDRIKANIGVPWRAQTVDNLIAGAPETPVKGVASTMMATLDVCRRALAAGRNMVVTHESTYFSHQDRTDILQDDPTYKYKRDFLEKNGMAVFHLHDHWHARRPDGIAAGMARELGWEKNMDPNNARLLTFPPTTLLDLVRHIESTLKIRTMRVVGDPKLPIRRVLTSWGFVSQMPGIPMFATPDIDAFLIGETHEWELVEYVQDTIASGKKKALVILGHIVSEQSGMRLFADWLKPLVPEVPVEFIAAPEPFWRPGDPVV